MKQVELIAVKKLTLLENNPRKITVPQLDKLCKSMQNDPTFFSLRPCLVHLNQGRLEVYAGNQRVLAAKKLKWKEVPCIVEVNLSEEVIKQRIIKDNQHYGEWDWDILGNEWDTDTLLDAGFTDTELSFYENASDATEQKAEDALQESEQESADKMQICPICGAHF